MIKLVAPENYEVEIEGSTFILRELTREERTEWYGGYSVIAGGGAGEDIPVENYKAFCEIVFKCLVGWRGVVDSKTKKDLPFDSKLVEWLPDNVTAQLASKIMEKMTTRLGKEKGSQKNLKATSGELK